MSSTTSTALPVLIIGSGLGGLTLAQSLAKHQIPYRIFERDSQASQRAQGYRISIGDGGADGLRAALPAHLYDKFEATCAEQHPPNGRVNARTGKLERAGILGLLSTGGWEMFWMLGKRVVSRKYSELSLVGLANAVKSRTAYTSSEPIPVLPTGGDKHLQVDRRVLRSILLTDQSQYITYDSAFESYTSDEKSVTAHFSNGTSVKGSLLVGADGVRSKVAAQLIGKPAHPRDLGMRLVYGKTLLTPEVEEKLHLNLQKGVSFVVDTTASGHRLLVVCECMRFTHDETPANYMFWCIAGRKEAFEREDTDLPGLSGIEAAELASELTKAWDHRIRIITDKQSVDETAVLRMSSSDPDGTATWPTDPRVTLLGDAIHCMPPTGGQGANSAMYDAALLGKILSESGEDATTGWSEGTISKYEKAMRYNIGDIVGLACIGAEYVIGGGPSKAAEAGRPFYDTL